jgi:gamma-glutamyltranspeptidase / glutathione hydrolase
MIGVRELYSSRPRPVLQGLEGAVSAAHPLAVAAGQEMLRAGGSAIDACIAAQAVLCVLSPDACGLGGDMFALLHRPGQKPLAINGSGAAPLAATSVSGDGADSVTVPGIVDAWSVMAAQGAKLSLTELLGPAIRLAETGCHVSPSLAAAAVAQRARLDRGGAGAWSLLGLAPGALWCQPELAASLKRIGREGAAGFYHGPIAAMIADAIQSGGGTLGLEDLAAHRTELLPPLTREWDGLELVLQPPVTQGVLLGMALGALEKLGPIASDRLDHAGIELTEASFAYRARAAEGAALLAEPLPIDLDRALHRGGPRAYLHTAGVAVSDRDGNCVSSLVSVFDDFGSCVFVPGGGFTLNNRAGGFTDGPNAAGPGRRPVHTLAPALITDGTDTLALATPGADGQVQTLFQVLAALRCQGIDLAEAISRPRWRSQSGEILIEESHPARERLAALGHRLRVLPDGDIRFGAVVAAGQIQGTPIAAADWRRETWSGIA